MSYDINNELFYCVKDRQYEKVKEILAKGRVHIDSTYKFSQKTVMHVAAENIDYKMVSLLLNYHPDLHVADKNGETALHYVADCKDVRLLPVATGIGDLLLKEDKSLMEVKDRLGRRPLDVCSQNKNELMGRLLVSKGASLEIKNRDVKFIKEKMQPFENQLICSDIVNSMLFQSMQEEEDDEKQSFQYRFNIESNEINIGEKRSYPRMSENDQEDNIKKREKKVDQERNQKLIKAVNKAKAIMFERSSHVAGENSWGKNNKGVKEVFPYPPLSYQHCREIVFGVLKNVASMTSAKEEEINQDERIVDDVQTYETDSDSEEECVVEEKVNDEKEKQPEIKKAKFVPHQRIEISKNPVAHDGWTLHPLGGIFHINSQEMRKYRGR